MKTIGLNVNVSLAAAVNAGRTQYGAAYVELDVATLALLTPAGKAWLAADGSKGVTLEVGDVGSGSVVLAIEEHVEKMLSLEWFAAEASENKIAEALAAPVEDWIRHDLSVLSSPSNCYLSTAQRADARILAHVASIESGQVIAKLRERAAREAEEKATRLENEKARAEVRKIDRAREIFNLLVGRIPGVTPDQQADIQERHAAGVLPDEELEALCLAVLLPADLGAPYVRLSADDVEHSDNCYDNGESRIKFAAEEYTGSYSAEEWAILKDARFRVKPLAERFGSALNISVRRHNAWCKHNDCSGDTYRFGLRLSLEWNGMTLVRELALW